MKVVVFTAIMVKDPIKDLPIDCPTTFKQIPNWDYVLITNIINGPTVFKNSGWKTIRVLEPPEEIMPCRNRKGWEIYANRWCKWHPDILFNEYDIIIYVDGFQAPDYDKKDEWIQLTNQLVQEEYSILQGFHSKDINCIYKEHSNIIKCNKDTYQNILKVTKYVKVMGYPENNGLFWNGCYIYKSRSKEIQKVWADLWADMLLYTYRDQSLLMFEIWRNNAFNLWGNAPLHDIIKNVDSDRNHTYAHNISL